MVKETTAQTIERLKAAKTVKEGRSILLESTINHYNSGNRAVEGGNCVYKPTEKSEGCAIGRLLPTDNPIKQKGGGFTAAASADSVFRTLPDCLSVLGRFFLRNVQALHDADHYWSDNGLTPEGMRFADTIKREFAI